MIYMILIFVMSYEKPKILTIYTSDDIVYINVKEKTAEFEMSEDKITFASFAGLNAYIEDITVKTANVMGYWSDLDYLIRQGYIKVQVFPTLREDCTKVEDNGELLLIYDGPQYGVEPKKDTTFQIGYFYLNQLKDLECGSHTYREWYGVD